MLLELTSAHFSVDESSKVANYLRYLSARQEARAILRTESLPNFRILPRRLRHLILSV